MKVEDLPSPFILVENKGKNNIIKSNGSFLSLNKENSVIMKRSRA